MWFVPWKVLDEEIIMSVAPRQGAATSFEIGGDAWTEGSFMENPIGLGQHCNSKLCSGEQPSLELWLARLTFPSSVLLGS